MSVTATTATSLVGRPPRPEVVGLRVHTHTEITPAWVRDSVLPLWDDARAGGRQMVSLRRGWLGGPHVDIVAVGPGSSTWAALARTVDAGPAPETPLSPEDYLDRARVRGQLENVAPPYLPLREHGSAILLDRPAVERGHPATARLSGVTEAVLAPAVVRSIRVVADEPSRLPTVLVDVLTTVADAHVLGAGYGTFSLRSHAEALLANWRHRGDFRAQFVARYAAQRAAVTRRVETILAGDGGGDVTAWRTALAYSRGVLDESVRRGELSNALVEGGVQPTPTAGPATIAEHPDTDFHRTVYRSGATGGAGEWFAAYRVLINCTYHQLPLLGVSPLQRAWGCWAVAEAVDEVLGQTWTDRLTDGPPSPQPAPSPQNLSQEPTS